MEEKEDYYDRKQSKTLSSFKHALTVIGIAFICYISFQIGTMISQESEMNSYINLLYHSKPDIEVGQVWNYTVDKGNPFEKEMIISKKVIGVKDDYVLFIQSYSDPTIGIDTMSESKINFIIGSELLNSNIYKFKLKYITVNNNIQTYEFKFDFVNSNY